MGSMTNAVHKARINLRGALRRSRIECAADGAVTRTTGGIAKHHRDVHRPDLGPFPPVKDRWFRKGTPEQAVAYREARKALDRNGREERVSGIRDETDRYHELNHAVAERERPLSGFQQWWHSERAVAEAAREDTARKRAARASR